MTAKIITKVMINKKAEIGSRYRAHFSHLKCSVVLPPLITHAS